MGQSSGVSQGVSGFCLVRGDSSPDTVLPGVCSQTRMTANPRESSDPLQTQIVSEISAWLFNFLEARGTGTPSLKWKDNGAFQGRSVNCCEEIILPPNWMDTGRTVNRSCGLPPGSQWGVPEVKAPCWVPLT